MCSYQHGILIVIKHHSQNFDLYHSQHVSTQFSVRYFQFPLKSLDSVFPRHHHTSSFDPFVLNGASNFAIGDFFAIFRKVQFNVLLRSIFRFGQRRAQRRLSYAAIDTNDIFKHSLFKHMEWIQEKAVSCFQSNQEQSRLKT